MTETAPTPIEPAPPPSDSPGQAPAYHRVLAVLQSLYPLCFPTDDADPKPLKIGIHKDLLTRLPEDVSATQLRNFLAWYTKRYRYRKVLTKGGQRVDLEGNPAGEVTEEQAANAKLSLKSKAPPPPPGSAQAQLPVDAPLTEDNTVPGRLELTIKFNELPKPVQVQAGYKFGLDCDGRPVVVTLRPKLWNKLAAAAEYPQWVAALTGKRGPREGSGFVLLEPALQVFEKKPKVQQGADTAAQEGTEAAAPQAPSTSPPAAAQEPTADTAPPQAASTPSAPSTPAAPTAAKPSAPKKPKLSLKR